MNWSILYETLIDWYFSGGGIRFGNEGEEFCGGGCIGGECV